MDNEYTKLHRRNPRFEVPLLAACMLTVGFLTGCTANSDNSGGSPSSKPQQSSAKPTPALDEQKLTKQVEEALGIETIHDNGPVLESGTERISDGIHTESALSRGKAYDLAVVCAGRGKVSLSVGLQIPVHQTINCDGVPFRQHINNSSSMVEIDTSGMSGAAGVVAWSISRVKR